METAIPMGEAITWALRCAAPITLILGSAFGVMLTASSMISNPFKIFGWVGGFVIAAMSGNILAPILMPAIWPVPGLILSAGYGWCATWSVISFVGKPADLGWLEGLRGLSSRKTRDYEPPGAKQKPPINITPLRKEPKVSAPPLKFVNNKNR